MRLSQSVWLQSHDQRSPESNHGSRLGQRDRPITRLEASRQLVHKKFESYTTLTADREQILNTIAYESYLKRPHPMKQNPNTNKIRNCYSTGIMVTLPNNAKS